MRTAFFLICISFFAQGQALRDINYKYLYDASLPFQFQLKSIRSGEGAMGIYNFQVRDTTENLSNYLITWEIRSGLQVKEGRSISLDSVKTSIRTKTSLSGEVILGQVPQCYLVAKVVRQNAKVAWLFYVDVLPKSPQFTCPDVNGRPLIKRYAKTNQAFTFHTDNALTISYYSHDFPAGTPVFSETMGRVSQGMQADSVFRIQPSDTLTPSEKGLYLIQPDTTSANGIAFRVENDYPRFAKIENLADPLIYICTRQEFEKVKKAKGDKQAFDRVILGITMDKDRAKTFMKTYYRRVEMANELFTSYKEGWKTDRGMIMIIFGAPTEVMRFADREVWNYSDLSFEFAKSATVFDPENYVLIRNTKYKDTWYEAIDLRRNGQF